MADYGKGNNTGSTASERSGAGDSWGRHGAANRHQPRGRRKDGRELAGSPVGSPALAPADRETQKERESRTAIFVSTDAPKLNLSSVLRKLTEFGHLKVHHFRDKQNFGFVEFVDEASVERAIAGLNGQVVDGQLIQVERCTRITPHKDPRQPENELSNTLVVKSLPYSLRYDNWVQLLDEFDIKPKNVTFLYDTSGSFRGISFVDYNTIEDATSMIQLLTGLEVGGRKLHAEYKKQPPKEDIDDAAKDEEYRRLFEQLRAFKDNPALQELAFPPSFTKLQRKLIHKIAEKLALSHWSQGEGDNRFIAISKHRKPAADTSAAASQSVDSSTSEAPPPAESGGWVRKQSALQQAARQPKIPDGTKGFHDEYRATRLRNLTATAPPLSWMSRQQ